MKLGSCVFIIHIIKYIYNPNQTEKCILYAKYAEWYVPFIFLHFFEYFQVYSNNTHSKICFNAILK